MYKNLLLFLCCISFPAFSDIVDVDALMSKNAQPAIDSLRNNCNKGGGSAFVKVLRQVRCPVSFPAKVEFSHVSFMPGEVRQNQLSIISFPDETSISTIPISNCTPEPIVKNEQFTISKVDEVKITKKDTVKTIKSNGSKATLNLTSVVKDVSGLEVNSSTVREVSFANGADVLEFIYTPHTVALPTIIPPYTLVVISEHFRMHRGSLDFDGDILVNGDVSNPGAKPLSYPSLVPNNKLNVKGSVSTVKHTSMNHAYHVIAIDPGTCQFTGSQVSEITDNYLAVRPLSTLPIKEVLPFSFTASVVTADVVANIRLRVRQVGSTACAVQSTSSTGSQSIYLPDGEWSAWKTLATPTATTAFNVALTHNCASNIEAELSYFK